jgi:HSP20 family protein
MAMFPTYRSNDPIDQLFNSVMGGGGRLGGGDLMRAPETDVVETEREIRVVAEMPGLNRDDIEIDMENNVLTISGEKREARTEKEEGRYHLSERRYGKFSRSFVLPRDVEADGIQASFQDGVLTVHIPKAERARRRKIEIGGGDGRPQQVEARTQENQEGRREG